MVYIFKCGEKCMRTFYQKLTQVIGRLNEKSTYIVDVSYFMVSSLCQYVSILDNSQ